MKDFSCSNCGAKVLKTEGKGQLFSFNAYGKVRLTQKCKILQCEACKEIYETAEDSARLNQALTASLTDNVIQILEVIRTKHNIRKTDVAIVCGVTPATLSRFKNDGDGGKQIPSEKFLILKRIAARGQAFIKEMLEEDWEIQTQRPIRHQRESENNKKTVMRVSDLKDFSVVSGFQMLPNFVPLMVSQMKRKI